MRRLGAGIDLRDAVAAIGLVLIGVGLGTVSTAAGLAVPGFLLVLLAVVPPFVAPRGGP